MKMDISPINTFVNREVKRYAKMLAHNFENVSLKYSRNKDNNGINYIFHSDELTHDLIFTIYDWGVAEFWKRRTFWRWRKNETSVTIAEWNVFADPFEVAISIQLRMYHTLSFYMIGMNMYHENFKDFHSDNDYMLGLSGDEGEEYDYDEPVVSDFIPGNSHEHSEAAVIDKDDVIADYTNIKPPYIDVTEEDYLDQFGL
ncbi:MAG: hypothetical protein IK990_18530 [Ruminiclostridium sp.]|nr:hypothetical protein [Ruminiclostridium sp.]MBP3857602.1 hypothetical protein [Ruminiclostridium sp.]